MTPQPPPPPLPPLPPLPQTHSDAPPESSAVLSSESTLQLPVESRADVGSASDRDEQPTILSTIRQLQSRSIAGRNLAQADRRACVEHLTSEGFSVAEIAEILKVSERTIIRDRKAVQQAHALEPHPELVSQMMGRLVREAELAIQRIRRVTREKQVSPAVRVDAEHRCFQILSELVQRLQGVGYIPTATQRVEADLLHRTAEVPDLDSLSVEVARLREVSIDSDGNVPEEVQQLVGELERASLAISVQRTAAIVQNAKGTSDE